MEQPEDYFRSSLFESDFGGPHRATQMGLLDRESAFELDHDQDFELDLEMNDLLDEFSSEEQVEGQGFELDIFAEGRDAECGTANCCCNAAAKKKQS